MATSPSRPGRCGIGSPKTIRIPRGVNWQTIGISAAPDRRATTAGPAGMVIG